MRYTAQTLLFILIVFFSAFFLTSHFLPSELFLNLSQFRLLVFTITVVVLIISSIEHLVVMALIGGIFWGSIFGLNEAVKTHAQEKFQVKSATIPFFTPDQIQLDSSEEISYPTTSKTKIQHITIQCGPLTYKECLDQATIEDPPSAPGL